MKNKLIILLLFIAATMGHTFAQSIAEVENYYNVAVKLYYGTEDTSQDYTSAYLCFMQVANMIEGSDLETQFKDVYWYIGRCYSSGEGVSMDIDKAIQYYKKSALLGDPTSQSSLANHYFYGVGVEQDYKAAFYWYTQAAGKGDIVAQCQLGDCYGNGYGVEEDEKMAWIWHSKAAEKGYDEAQLRMGHHCLFGSDDITDFNQAVLWYEKASNQGNIVATYFLGYCYLLNKDNDKAVLYLRIAAEAGFSEAQYLLAKCYKDGIGVSKNLIEAKKWCSRSADQGNTSAEELLQELR